MKKHDKNSISEWSMHTDKLKVDYILDCLKKRYGQEEVNYLTDPSGFFHQSGYLYSAHLPRYISSLIEIKRFKPLHFFNGLNILELGGASPILDYFSLSNDTFTSESDLRICIDCNNHFFDIIFAFEVIEHIKDQPERSIDEIVLFNSSGVRCFASEIERALKPGGLLFLTTPNPNSYTNLINLVKSNPPYLYRGHVREFTKNEILNHFINFDLCKYLTTNVFFNLNLTDEALSKPFENMGEPFDFRGDDHFFIFQKKF